MQFNRIEEFIRKNNIKLEDCQYHTLRSLENGGKIRILLLKGEENAKCEYICPKCGNYEYVEVRWRRPFSVRCSRCGFNIKVPRLYRR